MPDLADEANEALQQYIDIATTRPSPPKTHYKACRNCHDPTPNGEGFCDADCRDDYEKRNPTCNTS